MRRWNKEYVPKAASSSSRCPGCVRGMTFVDVRRVALPCRADPWLVIDHRHAPAAFRAIVEMIEPRHRAIVGRERHHADRLQPERDADRRADRAAIRDDDNVARGMRRRPACRCRRACGRSGRRSSPFGARSSGALNQWPAGDGFTLRKNSARLRPCQSPRCCSANSAIGSAHCPSHRDGRP